MASNAAAAAGVAAPAPAAAPTGLFVGVDGGGTKTAISLADQDGRILTTVTVGSSNPNSVTDAGASETVTDGIQQALKLINADVSLIRSVVLSISGCNSLADQLRINLWLQSMLPHSWSTLPGAPVSSPPATAPAGSSGGTLIHSYNDSIAALVSGTGGAMDGVVLIAGTGMIAKGFADGGSKEWTGGGNGALIDGGSGWALGIAVCRACFHAHDGMGPPTPLLQATLKFLQLERTEQIVDWLYADSAWARAASLAPLLFECASANPADPVSLSILQSNAAYLADSVKAVAVKLDLAASGQLVPVVCAGGLLQSPLYFGMVQERIKSFLPRADLRYPSMSPADGAALLALAKWRAHTQQTQPA